MKHTFNPDCEDCQRERGTAIDTFSHWSRQGCTDDRETPIDTYGRRVLSMVIRELKARGER